MTKLKLSFMQTALFILNNYSIAKLKLQLKLQ